MYPNAYQRARIRAVRRGVAYEDMPAPHARALVHTDAHQIVCWDEPSGAVVGLALVSVDGLPFVAFDEHSEALRADIAGALGVEPLKIEGLRRHGVG